MFHSNSTLTSTNFIKRSIFMRFLLVFCFLIIIAINNNNVLAFQYLEGKAEDNIYPKPLYVESSSNNHDCIRIAVNSTLQFQGGWTLDERQAIRAFYHVFFLNINPTHWRDVFYDFPVPQINIVLNPSLTQTDFAYNNTIPFGSNERYDIYANKGYIRIVAPSTFGVQNAFKTIAQLSYINSDHQICVTFLPFSIRDEPTYRYRGLMIDTGRIYYEVDFIKSVIRGMSSLKLNALHWHISDDQSFPFEIMEYPYLHIKGASHLGFIHNGIQTPQTRFYNTDEIKSIIDYAAIYGVRVIPEIDMPAHARSWGKGYNISTVCPGYLLPFINTLSFDYTLNVPLDISLELTYEIITAIIKSIATLFRDPYVHLGGDEIPVGCWGEDLAMMKRMASYGYSDPNTYFNEKSIEKDGSIVERGFSDRVWHRLIAISEKLWSSRNSTSKVDKQTIERATRFAKHLENQDIDIGDTINRIKNYDTEFN
ncbi:glycoside hydrolase family 20 protein [Heterostelium album PN500]|uniref:beta-N-acetylhexosaminidase n=1 Tax=Heterostelium pallidum (strain ATCC 26659 / Pp 5 / PN500) TaxID=670386 RepID=D3BCK6_HETP5|nr:glycoside hydrolase family 20 protein [Heterostelium album PN500]EFA80648.1 glycoside hydrolase family 20 protein [Heterostelium album PN500]|eukprot:XP_020432768.1 glycoside hydrolase family 20 protein [Heterostelium album PN500]